MGQDIRVSVSYNLRNSDPIEAAHFLNALDDAGKNYAEDRVEISMDDFNITKPYEDLEPEPATPPADVPAGTGG